jgi:allantoinase
MMKELKYAWPGQARIAVMVTVMFESWPEGKGPPYGPMASSLREGTLDLQSISWANYGGRTGIWRLMRIFDAHALKATICANAKSVERFPEAAKELVKRGHEIAGHSYTQDMFLPYCTPDEERDLIRRCASVIESVTGARIAGWASPRMTPTTHTARLLAESGYLWHGDYHDTDLPYAVDTGSGKIVALPHSDFTDNRVLRGSPRDFFDVYKDTFDFLYDNEPGALLNLTLHAHFGARPPLAAMIHKVLKYMRGFDGVWFARHDELARHVLA